MKFNKQDFIWLILAFGLRLFFMFGGFHIDLKYIAFGGYLSVVQGRLLTFYDYLLTLPESNEFIQNFGRTLFNYPPLAYIVPGIFMLVFKPLINQEFFYQYLVNPQNFLGSFQLMKHLFIFKISYLVADLLSGYFLAKIFAKKNQKRVFYLWLFNPFSLLFTFGMGQLDIWVVLSIIMAIYFALNKQNYYLSLICLGIGGAFKLLPLLFMPIIVCVAESKFWERVKLFFSGVLAYTLIIIPYYITSPGFRAAAFMTEQSNKMLYMTLPVTGSEGLPIFILIYSLIVYFAFYQKGIFSKDKVALWFGGFAFLATFFSVTHYHPQWFLWFTPFLIWAYINYGQKVILPLAVILAAFIFHWAFFEPSLHTGLLSGIFPQLAKLGQLEKIAGYPAAFWRNNFRAISAGSMIYLSKTIADEHV